MKTDSKLTLQERFVEARAEGRSYSDIALLLGTSKPTLIQWGRDLQKEVANARTLRMDALYEKYTVSKTKRIEAFGNRLELIFAELNKRSLDDVPTTTLFKLALEYGDKLKAEAEPLMLRSDGIPTFDI